MELKRQDGDEALNRFEVVVVGKLENAGFVVSKPAGWRKAWKRMWHECGGDGIGGGRGAMMFYCVDCQYGSVPLRVEIHRDDDGHGLGFSCEVSFKETAGWWHAVWNINVSIELLVIDHGFKASQLLGMGPEEVPF